MPNPGEIKYCELLGGRETNAAFVWIPPGSFWMGDRHDPENPERFVTITKGFWLQQTPLTSLQFSISNKENISDYVQGIVPKTELSWTAITAWCANKPFRLPTQAEWEAAARANVQHKYTYSGSNILNNVAWTVKNKSLRSVKAQPVAKLKSNTFALYDMSGNINEWCSDGFNFPTNNPECDPETSISGTLRIIRSGHYASSVRTASVAYVAHITVDTTSHMTGVRLVWES